MPGISIKNLKFGYDGKRDILKNISVDIEKGSFVGIAGANGSGKTTFSYLLNGIIPHYYRGRMRGTVRIDGISTDGKNIAFFSRKVGMLFQNPDFSLFNLTVQEEIGFVLKNFRIEHPSQKLKKGLAEVGLGGFENRDPHSLSFGEKQKVNLASILSYEPEYLVLDEPSSMLDYRSSVDLYLLLKKLNGKGKTVIVIEHDTDFLWGFTGHILLFDRGELVQSGMTKKILQNTQILNSLGVKIPDYDRFP